MKTAVVVNCAASHRKNYKYTVPYNLGVHKLGNWLVAQGCQVTQIDGDPGMFLPRADLYCLSVVFSWDVPTALTIALRVKDDAEVWIGGPGITTLGKWWKDKTGLDATIGVDYRFEYQRGQYEAVFASRGCPVGCSFCIVSKLEGYEYILDWDFAPAPILYDNNLSALPVEFQEHIIKRYQETDTPLLDANSGFEPRTFDEGTYRRWKPILQGPWRLGFDEIGEQDAVKNTLHVLAKEWGKRKRVFVLIGNEPIESCYERVVKTLEWGGKPYVQIMRPLNALSNKQYKIAYDWTESLLHEFQVYFNAFLFRTHPIWEHTHKGRDERMFDALKPKLMSIGSTVGMKANVSKDYIWQLV